MSSREYVHLNDVDASARLKATMQAIESRIRDLDITEAEWAQYLSAQTSSPGGLLTADAEFVRLDNNRTTGMSVISGGDLMQPSLPDMATFPRVVVAHYEGPPPASALGVVRPLRNGIDARDIQGNILAGFRKPWHAVVLVEFAGQSDDARIRAARNWLREAKQVVASTKGVCDFRDLFRNVQRPDPGLGDVQISSTWVTVSFTYPGLKILQADRVEAAESFFESAPNKPFMDWTYQSTLNFGNLIAEANPNSQLSNVHAIVIIEGDEQSGVDRVILRLTSGGFAPVRFSSTPSMLETTIMGPDGNLKRANGFGFKEGISQPGVVGFDIPGAPTSPRGPSARSRREEVKSSEGSVLVQPGEFLLGYDREPLIDQPFGDVQKPLDCPIWMRRGSFHVFEVHELNARDWNTAISTPVYAPHDAARRRQRGYDLAKLIGRYPEPTRVDAPMDDVVSFFPADGRPLASNSDDVAGPNDFTFEGDNGPPPGASFGDKGTPLDAHIRKMNPRHPRAEHPYARTRGGDYRMRRFPRIIRRGFSHRVENGSIVGRSLLFFHAYMASIGDQFEALMAHAHSADGVDGSGQIVANAGSDPLLTPVALPGGAGASKLSNSLGRFYAFTPAISLLNEIAPGN